MVDSQSFNQQLLAHINEARTKPKDFATKLRSYEQYFKGNVLRIPNQTGIMTNEGFKAFEEAANFLDKAESIEGLKFHTELTSIAADCLKEIQGFEKPDDVNSMNIDNYISKYGQVIGVYSQAVDFGSGTAELAAINLLCDDGDPNRGNRTNLLNGKFRFVGIAHGEQKAFHHATVLVYVRHFIKQGEDVGQLSDDNYEKPGAKSDSKGKSGQEPKEEKKSQPKEDPAISSQAPPDDDFDLPEGVVKIERQEKEVVEGGKKKKVIKLKKHMEDGTIETEVFKQNID